MMNSEAPVPEGEEPEDEIVVVSLAGQYYCVQGDEYISQLLLVDGTFPKPVRFLIFENAIDFSQFTGGTVNLSDYWAINPEVIKRLREDGHLLEIDVTL